VNAPGLDPRRQAVGAVHLWHLIDDPSALHALLKRGIERWGQLRSLVEQGEGGASLLPGGAADWPALEARGRALTAAFEAWRVGRGRPVDRAVLLDSGAVSDKFIDAVAALAADCAGDAKALIQALENGQVPRWQANKTEQLRDYLEAEGYLDPRNPATGEDIRIAVLRAVAGDLQQGRLDQGWIDRLIGGLPLEAEPGDGAS
jgi:hypothetical protein